MRRTRTRGSRGWTEDGDDCGEAAAARAEPKNSREVAAGRTAEATNRGQQNTLADTQSRGAGGTEAPEAHTVDLTNGAEVEDDCGEAA
eukprot:SAG11_NODE_3098_length_2695_cov_1.971121_1_plen_88_part_00